ncbi:MAG: cytochrome c biogenesis protein CcdA [Microbacteriaceae bacterium]|nr:cytochrome c biogenesis protein CcdA [Microbacteriaceae bacterium]
MLETLADGSLLAALAVAVLAGLLSFFSPCVLPLVPGYLAYVSAVAGDSGGAENLEKSGRLVAKPGRGRIIAGTLLFIAGFTVVFVGFFTVFGQIGALILRFSVIINIVLGVIIVLLGLVFIGAFRPLQKSAKIRLKPALGLAGAPLLGATFAVGWTPCIGPALAVILSLSVQQGTALRGGLLGVAYCLGLGLPFLAAACGFALMTRLATFVRRNMRIINLAGGILLIIIGLLIATGIWTALLNSLQGFLTSLTPAL